MTATIHPDEVLKAILAKGNRRDKEQKLQKLHELCALEYGRHSEGTRDLRLANMARIAESHGLFRARTIYNKQSEDYATLIRAWETYDGPKKPKIGGGKTEQSGPTSKRSFLDRIDDPAIRSLCLMAMIERDKLRAELNLLKSQTQVVINMRPIREGITGSSNGLAVNLLTEQLTESERNALQTAIDPDLLAERNWKIGNTGEVLDQNGRFVFYPGFTTGIAKILRKT